LGAPALLELQHALCASLLSRDNSGAAAHIAAGRFSQAERLDVYRDTLASVLTNALRLSYPAVHRLVGKEFFEAAAHVFLTGHPPTSAWLDDYGADFPDFLAEFAPAKSLAYLPEVARLERAVSRALHADDIEALDPARLLTLAEAERARVRFAPHPSLTLVHARYPVDSVWRSVLDEDDAALAQIDLCAGPVWLLAQRLKDGIDVKRMTGSEWRLTAELCAGQPLHAVLSQSWDCDVSALLASHLTAGRFVDFALDGGPGKP
jgi:hypothetical protein